MDQIDVIEVHSVTTNIGTDACDSFLQIRQKSDSARIPDIDYINVQQER